MDELFSLKVVIYTLLSVGICQSVIFSASMYNKQQYLLSTWLALFSFEVISKLLLSLKIFLPVSQWFGFWFTLDLIYGPLLLLWVLMRLNTKPLSFWHLLHFLPFVIYLTLIVPEVMKQEEVARWLTISAYLQGGEWARFSEIVMLIQSLTLWHPLLYSTVALVILIRYRYKPQAHHVIKTNWLLYMLSLHIVMWFMVIFGLAFVALPSTLLYMLSYLPTIIWVNVVTYLSLSYIPLSTKSIITTTEKYAHHKLASPQLAKIATQLDAVMEQGLFSRPRLTLAQISEKIDVPSHYVSQVINEFYQCNFFDYVNTHRLKGVKKQLKDAQYINQTILDIALDNGFSSKSTFNTAFKKHTGMTPSEFRKHNTG